MYFGSQMRLCVFFPIFVKNTNQMKTKMMLLAVLVLAMTGCKNGEKALAEKQAAFDQWNDAFGENFQSRAAALEADQEALLAFRDSAITAFTDYNRAALEENLDNVIGVSALQNLYGFLEDDEVAAYVEKITADVQGQDSLFLASLRESIAAKKQTAEGQMFADFEVDGVKFSDFVGKGKYVLVDFWASWCGPCRGEMPNLRAVYDEFHGPQFDMLSVAVWDKPEDTAKAAEEEKIAWNQIVNAQKIPTDLYGIEGIPHIILFGPDGTILKRNLRGDDIREAVAEALGR